jgi:hypothetical protein
MTPPFISDLVDSFKLKTEFRHDCTIEITRTNRSEQGRRAVRTEKKWTKHEYLGSGAFGEVWLEKDQLGDARAVKDVRKRLSTGVDYHKELLAMANLSKVWYGSDGIQIAR